MRRARPIAPPPPMGMPAGEWHGGGASAAGGAAAADGPGTGTAAARSRNLDVENVRRMHARAARFISLTGAARAQNAMLREQGAMLRAQSAMLRDLMGDDAVGPIQRVRARAFAGGNACLVVS